MKNTFSLFDIANLVNAFKSSSISHDCLADFLKKYAFNSIYTTLDDSVVYEAGGRYSIEIEIFNFENPISRKMNIYYIENNDSVSLYY